MKTKNRGKAAWKVVNIKNHIIFRNRKCISLNFHTLNKNKHYNYPDFIDLSSKPKLGEKSK